jgi:hypothetical protein
LATFSGKTLSAATDDTPTQAASEKRCFKAKWSSNRRDGGGDGSSAAGGRNSGRFTSFFRRQTFRKGSLIHFRTLDNFCRHLLHTLIR